jgi:hypothetical protein
MALLPVKTRAALGLALLGLCVLLSGCAAALTVLALESWFKSESPDQYLVYLDGYNLSSSPSITGDLNLAGVAADALGQIGGDAAVQALQQALARAKGRLRTEVAAACLACAERTLAQGQNSAAAALYVQLSGAAETEPVRMAAWRGILRANPEQGIGAVCAALTSGDPALGRVQYGRNAAFDLGRTSAYLGG